MDNVVLYGLGNVGKSMLPYLSMRYNILFWVDSNKAVWNSKYKGIIIKSPESLVGYEGIVIVTTTDKYFIEISDNLLEIGIKKENIYRGQHQIYDQQCEVVPYEYKMLSEYNEEKCLQDYDMLRKEEEEAECKVLIFGAFYTIYMDGLVKNIKKRYSDISISVLTNSEKHFDTLYPYASHIYVYHSNIDLKFILDKIPKYDVFQFLWIENIWVYFKDVIRNKCRKLNLCIGGSDLYRARDAEIPYKYELIKIADNISAETEGTIEYFYKIYPEVTQKLKWVNFGLEVIEKIDCSNIKDILDIKRKLSIHKNKIVVVCGHNANSAHNHLKIIEALGSMRKELREKIFTIFPMTYNVENSEYIEIVEEKIKSIGISYKILKDYMNLDEMAELDKISDVMIHVQNTDQLSSSMLEQMYSGAIIIAGSWLPYKMLEKKGIYFLTVDCISDITKVLEDVIMNIDNYKERCKKNTRIVQMMSSWDYASGRWMDLWS